MPFWAHAVFAFLLVTTIVVPMTWPQAVGLSEEAGWWGLAFFAPVRNHLVGW